MSPPEALKIPEKKQPSLETRKPKETQQKLVELKSEIERQREQEEKKRDGEKAEKLFTKSPNSPPSARGQTTAPDSKTAEKGGMLDGIQTELTAIWEKVTGSLENMWGQVTGLLGSVAASLGLDRWLPDAWKGQTDEEDHEHLDDEEDETADKAPSASLVQREISPEVQQILDRLPKRANGELLEIRNVRDAAGHVILQSGANDHTPAVHKSVAPDLIGMALDFFQKTGEPLRLTYCYRDINKQQALYNKLGDISKGGLAAVPGTSPHNCGCALDVDRRSFESPKIGGRDGFVALGRHWNFSPHKKEAWHFDHANLYRVFPRATRIAQTKQLNDAYHA